MWRKVHFFIYYFLSGKRQKHLLCLCGCFGFSGGLGLLEHTQGWIFSTLFCLERNQTRESLGSPIDDVSSAPIEMFSFGGRDDELFGKETPALATHGSEAMFTMTLTGMPF